MRVGERRAPSARAGSRATPRRSCPTDRIVPPAPTRGNRCIALVEVRLDAWSAVRRAVVAAVASASTVAEPGSGGPAGQPRPKPMTRNRPIAPGRAAASSAERPPGRPPSSSPGRPGSRGAARSVAEPDQELGLGRRPEVARGRPPPRRARPRSCRRGRSGPAGRRGGTGRRGRGGGGRRAASRRGAGAGRRARRPGSRSRSAAGRRGSRPGGRRRDPGSSARQISARWPSSSATPSAARRAASAGVDGSASTSTNCPVARPDEDLAQRDRSRTTTRCVGSASRTSLARTTPAIGSAVGRAPTRTPARPASPRRSAIASRRRGSTSIGS